MIAGQQYAFLVPDDIFELTVFQGRLYAHYLRLGHTNESIHDSAKICQMSVGMVSRCRRELAELGRITIDSDESGFVYLLESSIGLYKIGMAKNVDKRMAAFSGLPFEVSLICSIEAHNMRHLEKALHYKYAEKWVRAEWFALTPDDVKYIKGLAVKA